MFEEWMKPRETFAGKIAAGSAVGALLGLGLCGGGGALSDHETLSSSFFGVGTFLFAVSVLGFILSFITFVVESTRKH